MLYQNVRPENFSEVVGNTGIIESLIKIVKRSPDKRPHTYLFSGPSGCGKTTLARILVKELGCSPESITELNAANTRGIDTIRDLTTNAGIRSIFSDNKTYIIDESHQLTKAAQEALLKVIEDCPPHCYFIFCTTQPENLLSTILNRCTKFVVKKLTLSEIVDVLFTAADKNNITELPSEAVLNRICEISNGCPREALNCFEQVEELGEEDALSLLSASKNEQKNIFDLSKLLALKPSLRDKKWKEILRTFNLLEGDSEQIRLALLKIFLSNLSKCSQYDTAKNTSKVIEILSSSTIYGGRTQLCALLVRCCFITDY